MEDMRMDDRLDNLMKEANKCMDEKDYAGALELTEQVVKELEKAGIVMEDDEKIYKDFSESFQFLLYMMREMPAKSVADSAIPYARIYCRYGSLLFEAGEYEKARAALEEAMKWNPVDAMTAFEYAETFKAMKDLDGFFRETKKIHKICYRPATIARYYRNLAYYYSEKKMFDEASACILLSGAFDGDSPNFNAELEYIRQMSGKEPTRLEPEDISDLLDREGIPQGADTDVLRLALEFAKKSAEEEQLDGLKYYMEIVYGLTDDEMLRQYLGDLDEMMKGK